MIDPTYTTKIKARRKTHVKYYLCTDEEVLTEIQEEEQREQEQREQEQRESVSRVPQTPPTNSLLIDRTQPFNPSTFIGEGWSFWKGPIDGNGLKGKAAQDERSLVLSEVDLSQVRFETMLKDGESSIRGEEKLERLKASGNIRLDAKILQTLWENKHFIPESWKERVNGNIRYIFFCGTELRSSDGDRFLLCLYWGVGGWGWYYDWIGRGWGASYLLAGLVRPTS